MKKKKFLHKFIKFIILLKKEVIFSIIIATMLSVVGIIETLIFSYIIDNILIFNTKYTLFTGIIIFLLVGFLQVTLTSLKNIIIQKTAYNLDFYLVNIFYQKILDLNFDFLNKTTTGDLISRFNDVQKVRKSLSEGFISIISNIFIFVFIGSFLFCMNKILFLILFICIIFLLFVASYYGLFFHNECSLALKKYSDIQSFIIETLYCIETIKTYPAKKEFQNEYQKRQKKSLLKNWNIEEKNILYNFYVSLIEKISIIIIIFCSCFFVTNDKSSLGDVFCFISLSSFFVNSVKNLLNLQSDIFESFAAMKRLFLLLDEDGEVYDKKLISMDISPNIKFENIYFSYNSKNFIYENLNLNIVAGTWIAFIGETGCGKTTIAKLLLKLYIPQKGKILFNNVDLNLLDTTWLRSKIAYISQDIVLFSGTIIDNMSLFNETITFDKIVEVAKLVGIHDKIQGLPHQYNSIIGERGIFLSGGERQKIAIARALLKKAFIYIFDEVTSNLDYKSERKISDLVFMLKQQGCTIISIAHRLSSIEKCDKIYVLEKVNIIKSGSFIELNL